MSEYDLHERIAKCLGWTVDEVRSFSLASAREMVRTKDAALADEISLVIQQGLHLTEPIRDPRRVPMPDMSWLGPPPPRNTDPISTSRYCRCGAKLGVQNPGDTCDSCKFKR